MRQPISPQKKAAIKKSYLTEGLSLEAAAQKHGVSARKVHGWSSAEGWAEQKFKATSHQGPAVKLVSFPTARGGQALADQQPEALGEPPRSVRDMVNILDRAIARLSNAVHCPADGRNRANAAQALAKLIDQRAKLSDDKWLFDALLSRYPTPMILAKVMREHYGDPSKLKSYEEALIPMTAAHVAEMAMEAGLRPEEFLGHLETAWQGKKDE
jgi:transposase-like protein